MKKAFTLMEILIVVAILGILGAILIPIIQGHTTEAKEAAAKDTLRILRNAIEFYASRHNGVPPGYVDNDPSGEMGSNWFTDQLIMEHYLSEFPENPFNGRDITKMVGNSEDFPTEPFKPFVYGWVYKPATKTIRLNWQGTDSTGTAYFDY
jgi:prepilin-type N-terminal cleavage/methylation domain-containing protein